MQKAFIHAIMGIMVTLIGVSGLAYAAPGSPGGATPNANSTFTQTQQGTDIGVAGAGQLTGSDKLINTIQTAINILLGLLGTIALVILLWGGFQMVTAAGDENKHKKGFTILRQAGIGLLFIGLAALFVQLIFWFITSITQ